MMQEGVGKNQTVLLHNTYTHINKYFVLPTFINAGPVEGSEKVNIASSRQQDSLSEAVA